MVGRDECGSHNAIGNRSKDPFVAESGDRHSKCTACGWSTCRNGATTRRRAMARGWPRGLPEGPSTVGGQCSRPSVCRPSAVGEAPVELDHHLAEVVEVERGACVRSRIGGDDRPRVAAVSPISAVGRGLPGGKWFDLHDPATSSLNFVPTERRVTPSARTDSRDTRSGLAGRLDQRVQPFLSGQAWSSGRYAAGAAGPERLSWLPVG